MNRARRALPILGLLIAAVAVTGCQAAHPPGHAGGPPGSGQSARAAAAGSLDDVRMWDACALHDTTAAAHAAGGTVTAVMPSDDLNECVLRVADGPGEFASDLWNFYIRVERITPSSHSKPVTLAGQQFTESTLGGDDDSCTAALPVGADGWGISLSAQPGSSEKKPGAGACQVAETYATALVPLWQHPPKRTDGRTQPALHLAELNPCATQKDLAALLNEPDVDTPAPDSPTKCMVIGTKDIHDTISVSFVFSADPMTLLQSHGTGTTTYQAVQVNGQPAVQSNNDGTCQLQIPYQPTTYATENALSTKPEHYVQVINVDGPSCGQAVAAAQKVLTQVAAAPSQDTHPAPTGGQPVLTLGDQRPGSSPASVGAPWDPCTIVTWDDIPAAVRAPKPSPPAHRPPDTSKGDDYKIGCRFDNSQMRSNGKDWDSLMVYVVWGTNPPMSADPKDWKNAQPTEFSGKHGLLKPMTEENGTKACVAMIRTANGVAGVSTSNSRFPSVDPCSVTKPVADALASRTP